MEDRLNEARKKINNDLMIEIRKWIVGYEEEIKQIIICLLAGGPELRAHVLLEGVPGIAKTRLARAISNAIAGGFKRVQGTPDLLPTDITGVQIWNTKECCFETRQGPVFTNILLFDEINRATPRTQSALLEAMQEGEVTIENLTHRLPDFFMVFATENPIESNEATFPLPEAQMDRFMMQVRFGYVSKGDEITIARWGNEMRPLIEKVLEISDIFKIRAAIRDWVKIEYKDSRCLDYIVELVRATRPETSSLTKVHQEVKAGASPRAIKALEAASRVHAFLAGRNYVIPDDIKLVALPILRHRITINPLAVDGNTLDAVDGLVNQVIDEIDKELKK